MGTYEQVWTYYRQGWTLDAIAHQVGLSWRTVPRDLQSSTFPERQPRHGRGRSLLDPYKATLLAGWSGAVCPAHAPARVPSRTRDVVLFKKARPLYWCHQIVYLS
jgi:hypothetical protein